MATYKVIQDIEAEDHILGPLTLRQFIYGLITVFFLYLCFISLTKHASFLIILFLPPAAFFGFLAFPFRQDQPTEIWALAKVRFIFKPRKRIWDQSGVKELVTITVPKKIEVALTNGLNQTEVTSRLHALADTIDSRGWVIKNVNVNLSNQNSLLNTPASDRLIDISSVPQAVPDYDISPSDDILDETSNPIAQHMEQMLGASSQAHRQQIIQELSDIPSGQPAPAAATPPASAPATTTQPQDLWFLQQPAATQPAVNHQGAVIAPSSPSSQAATPLQPIQPPTYDEQALLEHIKENDDSEHDSYAHLRTLQPIGTDQPAVQPPVQTAQSTQTPVPDPQAGAVTPPTDTAILSLANNNDLNVATIAREASKAKSSDEPPQDEVVISLR
jgi:hypothetical protein